MLIRQSSIVFAEESPSSNPISRSSTLSMTVEDEYSISIPESIILKKTNDNELSQTETLGIKGNITTYKSLVIKPDSSIVLKDQIPEEFQTRY